MMLDPAMFDPNTYQPKPFGWLSDIALASAAPGASWPTVPGTQPAPQMAPDILSAAQRQQRSPLEIMPPQPQSQAQQPGIFGSIGNGIANNSNMLMALGAGIMQGGLSKGLQAAIPAAQYDRQNRSANLTEKVLISKGIDPATARAAVSNPDMLKTILPQVFGTKDRTDSIKEYEYARGQGYAGNYEQWLREDRSAKSKLGLNPVWGTDAQGKPVILQLSDSGADAQRVNLPPGVALSTGVDKIDLGTRWGLQDRKNGNIVGYLPKDIEGKEAAEERGKALGQAQVNLPAATSKAEQSLAIIDKIEKHPSREMGTGASWWTTYVPGTGVYDFGQLVKQLEGRAFLDAFETLKGGGQITQVEGEKATQAIARLKTAQTEQGFLDALNDLKGVLKTGMERARQKAGVSPATPSPVPADPLGIR